MPWTFILPFHIYFTISSAMNIFIWFSILCSCFAFCAGVHADHCHEKSYCRQNINDNVKVFTVATEQTDGYKRYMNSVKFHNIEIITLGFGEKWKGGSHIIKLLKNAVEPYKNDQTIIIYTDSYDVVFTSGINEILTKFKRIGSKILFGADVFCWPNDLLKNDYPVVSSNSARYLNSGMFIGYSTEIFEMLNLSKLSNISNDQEFYTEIFLNENLRNKFGIQLDTESEIFQNLNGASGDVKFDVNENGEGELLNINFLSIPNILHGNANSKVYLNSIANYLNGNFKNRKCIICNKTKSILNDEFLPSVSISLFIERPVPFFDEFLENILSINYPKHNIDLFIHCNTKYHDVVIKNFIHKQTKDFKSIKSILISEGMDERTARIMAIQSSKEKNNDFNFMIDNDVQINNPEILRDLIEFNKSIIAPVLSQQTNLVSNFWGALDKKQFFAKSFDYADIVRGTLKGMWNVPFVSLCYLIKKNIFDEIKFKHNNIDPDMSLCKELRSKEIFMFVTNTKNYGHLIDTDGFSTSLKRPELYSLLKNPKDWEKRYIHPQYYNQLIPKFKHVQPCPDVYWFPILTENFCDDLVTVAEDFGEWTGGTYKSDGPNNDPVPTSDIYMSQIDLNEVWLRFLKQFVRPLVESVYLGYYSNPPRSLVNFIVRYKPDEQSFLRPHHDTSTYTINIALNRAEIDYTGGGCKFVRYNCSVTDTKKGWMLMHPGQLTHLHEGLKVITGTRYIMVSFVDPR